MRKVIRTYGIDWEIEEYLKRLLDVQRLPDFIFIDTYTED